MSEMKKRGVSEKKATILFYVSCLILFLLIFMFLNLDIVERSRPGESIRATVLLITIFILAFFSAILDLGLLSAEKAGKDRIEFQELWM